MAASSSAIRAGRAFVEIFVDGSKLAAGLKAAAAKLKAWGSSITAVGTRVAALGAGITGPLTAMAIPAAKSGAELYDMARRTGMSVQALSGLGYAAAMSGSSLEFVTKAIARMQKSITGSKDDLEGTTGNLDHLGLSLAAMKGLSPEAQFAKIAERISAMPDPTERAAAAMKVFGRGAAELIPVLQDFGKYSAQAKAFGLIKDPAAIATAKAMDQAMTLLSLSTKSLTETIGTALMPYLREMITRSVVMVLGVRDWVKENKSLIVTLFKWGSVAAGAGIALVGLGKGMGVAGKVLSGIGSIIPAITGGFTALGTILAGLLSPLGLILAGIAGLGAYLLIASGAGSKALEGLGGSFGLLRDDGEKAFKGISDALMAGDIGLAAKILWATLKVEWSRGTLALTNIWNAFANGLGDILSSLGPVLVELGKRIVQTMLLAGMRAAGAIKAGLSNAGATIGIERAHKTAVDTETADFGQKTDAILANKKSGKWTRGEVAGELRKAMTVHQAAMDAIEKTTQQAYDDLIDKNEGDKALKDAMGDVWSKPLPPLDTAKFDAAMKGMGLSPEQQKAVDDANAELKKSIADRDALVNKAGGEAKDKQSKYGGAAALETPEELMKRLQQKMGGVPDALAAANTKVVSTFSAAGAFGLAGGGGAAERTAKATESMAQRMATNEELTKKMLQRLSQGAVGVG